MKEEIIKRQIKQKHTSYDISTSIAISIGIEIINFMNLNKIRNMPIKNIDLTKVSDGIYKGDAHAGNYKYKRTNIKWALWIV